jgi:hypothetical protein
MRIFVNQQEVINVLKIANLVLERLKKGCDEGLSHNRGPFPPKGQRPCFEDGGPR